MKRKQQMSKNTRQTEKVASGSPYINRCGEYTIEAEFAGSSSLESCIADISMKNTESHDNECFDNSLKMNTE